MNEWFEIFRTGTHTDSQGRTREWLLKDLEELASNYDTEHHEAPIVIGHPREDSPAYGWIESLRVEGEKLLAKPKQLIDEFKDWVSKGLYKKVSIALYPDMTLRHVGFLGGTPPAVKGLATPQFSEKAEWELEIEITNNLGKLGIGSEFNSDLNSQILPSKKGGIKMTLDELWEKIEGLFKAKKEIVVPPAFTEADIEAKVKEAKDAAFAEAQKKVEVEVKAKEEAEKKLREIEAKASKEGIHTFCEGLTKKEGKLTPALSKLGIEEFMFSLDDGESFLFMEGKQKPKREWFMDFLKALPKMVEFSEVTPKDGPAGGGNAGQKMTALIRKKMGEKKDLTFQMAFSEVQMENPELAKEYLSEISPKQ